MNGSDQRRLDAAMHLVQRALGRRPAVVLPRLGTMPSGESQMIVAAVPQVRMQPVHFWAGLGDDFVVYDIRVGNSFQLATGAGGIRAATLGTMLFPSEVVGLGVTVSMMVRRITQARHFSGAITGYEVPR